MACLFVQAREYPLQEAERRHCAGGEWHGCHERLEGPWMALASRPRSGAGVREVERSETRMAGVRFFGLLFFAHFKEK
ncbi:hypothetical protein PSEUDO8Z_100012 [Pseudomonas sp. 8Z]|nr:hypothetical protein PSEUDO8Z_100012 [Pseudomonas sp. 8Z]